MAGNFSGMYKPGEFARFQGKTLFTLLDTAKFSSQFTLVSMPHTELCTNLHANMRCKFLLPRFLSNTDWYSFFISVNMTGVKLQLIFEITLSKALCLSTG